MIKNSWGWNDENCGFVNKLKGLDDLCFNSK